MCHFDPITGEGWVYLPPPPNFCHKTRTAIDFSRNFEEFNVCFQVFCWRKVATFNYFSKNCLKISQKILKLDNIPSIRYRTIWSHHVPIVKQHIRSYYLQLLIYSKNRKKCYFCWWQQNNPKRHTFFRFFKIENCSEKQNV